MNNKYRYGDERSEKAIAFLAAIEKVCQEFKMSLSHQDHHGGFEIEPYSKRHMDWLKGASENERASDQVQAHP